MIDLDPNGSGTLTELVDEFMFPDQENHIAYRSGRRMGARDWSDQTLLPSD